MYIINSFGKLYTIAFLILMLIGCNSKLHRVLPYSETMKDGDYIFYNLPETEIKVTIYVSKVNITPQESNNVICKYDKYKNELQVLGVKKPKFTGSFLSMGKIAIDKRSIPDEGNRYGVELSEEGSATLTIQMDPAGIPSKATSEVTSDTIPIAKSLINLIGAIASPAILARAPTVRIDDDICDMKLMNLRDAKQRMLELYSSMGAADDKELIKFKVAELNTSFQTAVSAFTGVRVGKSERIVCKIRPSPAIKEYFLIKWSGEKGIIEQDERCLVPEAVKLNKENILTGSKDEEENVKLANQKNKHTYLLRIDPLKGLADIKIPNTETKDRSFYYRIPRLAEVYVMEKIDQDNQSKKSIRMKSLKQRWYVNQLGVITSLPRIQTKGSASINVSFDAETGAITEISAARTKADASGLIDTLATQSTAYKKARASEKATLKAEQAEQAKLDLELQALQREQAILEAMVAIENAKEALYD
ncbi:MAG: DUF4831 family protein [Candidatus Thiodiazotropha endolucinida]